MDILAHALWTNIAYYKKYRINLKNRLWAVFFGVAPDLISFAPSTIYLLLFSPGSFLQYKLSLEVGRSQWYFRWAVESYNYSHSLIIFLVVFLVLRLALKKFYWPMLGWPLHILIDIFTHKDFFETPFMFPLSNFANHHGVVWSEPRFMIINYSALACAYIVIFYFYRKHAQNK